MDTRTKRKYSEAVRKRFSKDLMSLGFSRTKTSFWTREREFVVEFIHLHLFSFMPAFRVHLGIRVLNDSFDAPALNGLSTADGRYGQPPRYRFEFADNQESVGRCADDLARFVRDVAVAWFERFADPQALVADTDSPLREDERQALEGALAGRSLDTRVAASKTTLGVHAAKNQRPGGRH
jgi:hypothetical protein